MQRVIAIMRKQASGRIVNITFMGGRIAIPLTLFIMALNLPWTVN